MVAGGVICAGLVIMTRDVEVIGEQPAGFDRSLVAAIDQDDALARQRDERKIRRGARRRRRAVPPSSGPPGRLPWTSRPSREG